MTVLVEALLRSKHTFLEELGLEGVGMGAIGMAALASLVDQGRLEQLKMLSISQNKHHHLGTCDRRARAAHATNLFYATLRGDDDNRNQRHCTRAHQRLPRAQEDPLVRLGPEEWQPS